MQIVVLDGYCVNPGDVDWGPLKRLGTVSVYDRTHPDMIAQRLRGADAVFVNKVKLSRDVIFGARQLRFIGVLATGYDVIDVDAARERGIVVTNVPAYSTEAVAQHAIATMRNALELSIMTAPLSTQALAKASEIEPPALKSA